MQMYAQTPECIANNLTLEKKKKKGNVLPSQAVLYFPVLKLMCSDL